MCFLGLLVAASKGVIVVGYSQQTYNNRSQQFKTIGTKREILSIQKKLLETVGSKIQSTCFRKHSWIQ